MVKARRNILRRALWILLLSMFLLVFISPAEVHAQNRIESIQIEANIRENGSVVIRDHRIFYADRGTEHYISLGNLGESRLLSFVVYDENNKALEYEDAWNINASLSEKAGKYGINYTSSGLELCFGLGTYGRREFTVEYELSNFVFNLLDDHQAFYWQFINLDMDPIGKIEIHVGNEIFYEFKYPESRIWGFGHEGGNTEISDHILSFNSGNNFRQSDYVVLLGIFEGSPFSTGYSLDTTSTDLIETAMKGTSPGETEENSRPGQAVSTFFFLLPFLFTMIPILLVIGVSAKKTKYETFIPTVKDQYYREVPYNKHLMDTQFFTGSDVSDWISALILKWISESRLTEQVEQVGFIFKRDKLSLGILPNMQPMENELEGRLWFMLVAAAGDDRILAEKEFNQYVKRNLKSFNSWTEDVKEQSRTVMLADGCLEKSTEKVLKIISRTRFSITPKGQELGDRITAFKNYLKDFSLIEERGVSHVVLWQELMIWAAFMGVAEEVYEQLKIANPQIEYEMPYSTRTIMMTHAFANSVQSTQVSANSSSSGGGGGSFGGGGGGSFGGGSGGGSR